MVLKLKKILTFSFLIKHKFVKIYVPYYYQKEFICYVFIFIHIKLTIKDFLYYENHNLFEKVFAK